mgnify:CR=1 FL=1
MAAAVDPGAIIVFLALALFVLYSAYYWLREAYRRDQLWKFIDQDEELADPLEILYLYKAEELYLYKAEEVENQQ